MLIEQIKAAQIAARKAKSAVEATLLTTLLGEANMVAKNAQRETPTDDEVQEVVRKFLKGNRDTQTALQIASADQAAEHPAYISSDVCERLRVAKEEEKILNEYLPQQLSDDQLLQAVQNAIAAGHKAIGPVMGYLKSNHEGLYDGKKARTMIEDALNT